MKNNALIVVDPVKNFEPNGEYFRFVKKVYKKKNLEEELPCAYEEYKNFLFDTIKLFMKKKRPIIVTQNLYFAYEKEYPYPMVNFLIKRRGIDYVISNYFQYIPDLNTNLILPEEVLNYQKLYMVIKKNYSPENSYLSLLLKKLYIDTVYIAGALLEVCIMGTIFYLFERGYELKILKDACLSRTCKTKNEYLLTINLQFGEVLGNEELVL